MTIKELINALSQYPADTPVEVWNIKDEDFDDLGEVRFVVSPKSTAVLLLPEYKS